MTTHHRSAELGHVVKSINMTGETICVDFFKRTDGTFGFEEYRRDVETGEGWFPIGFHSGILCTSMEDAVAKAVAATGWLEDEL